MALAYAIALSPHFSTWGAAIPFNSPCRLEIIVDSMDSRIRTRTSHRIVQHPLAGPDLSPVCRHEHLSFRYNRVHVIMPSKILITTDRYLDSLDSVTLAGTWQYYCGAL